MRSVGLTSVCGHVIFAEAILALHFLRHFSPKPFVVFVKGLSQFVEYPFEASSFSAARSRVQSRRILPSGVTKWYRGNSDLGCRILLDRCIQRMR